MNRKNLERKTEVEETLSADEARVRRLLGDLKRVGAPADFDFRLKARIARAKPQAESPRAARPFAVLRYVLPLGLVILVSAFAVFNGVYFADRQSLPPIGEIESRTATPPFENSVAAIVSQANEAASTAVKETETAGISIEPKGQGKKNVGSSVAAAEISGKSAAASSSAGKDANETSVDSRDRALAAAKIVAPPGLDSSRAVRASPNPDNGKSLTAREVLLQLGIEADFKNDGWKIKRVVPNSLAERSGVRAGDSVEAIDGEKLTDEPLARKTIEGKNLTISRGAQKIELSLAAKPN